MKRGEPCSGRWQRMGRAIVREWLSHNDNDPLHLPSIITTFAKIS
jgi:hypothetical protein